MVRNLFVLNCFLALATAIASAFLLIRHVDQIERETIFFQRDIYPLVSAVAHAKDREFPTGLDILEKKFKFHGIQNRESYQWVLQARAYSERAERLDASNREYQELQGYARLALYQIDSLDAPKSLSWKQGPSFWGALALFSCSLFIICFLTFISLSDRALNSP